MKSGFRLATLIICCILFPSGVEAQQAAGATKATRGPPKKTGALRTVRGKLFGMMPSNGGGTTFALDTGKQSYELKFSSETKYVGIEGNSFGRFWNMGDAYEVIGQVKEGSRFGATEKTIHVKRIKYVGKAKQ